MTPELEALILRAVREDAAMSEEELRAARREQAISFVYGNLMGRVTREEVAELYDRGLEALEVCRG